MRKLSHIPGKMISVRITHHQEALLIHLSKENNITISQALRILIDRSGGNIMGVTQEIQHKTTSGKLFEKVEDALEYDASWLKLDAAVKALGKQPDSGFKVTVTKKALDQAIEVFKEECEHWLPGATKDIFNPDRARTFHESFIGRYISDNDTPLKGLSYVLCCIDTDRLLMYEQIYAKNNPHTAKFRGQDD